MRIEGTRTMSEIVCATDLEHESLAAESVAYKLAQALGCRLRLVHVDPTLENVKFYHSYVGQFIQPSFWDTMAGELTAEKSRKLRHRIHAIGAAADPNVTFDVLMGKAGTELLSFIKSSRTKIEMVVLSKRKRNFFDEFLLGSVAHRLVENLSDVPVLLVPNSEEIFLNWQPRLITVASMLGAGSGRATRLASKLAMAVDANLELVHVMPEQTEYEAAHQYAFPTDQADDLATEYATLKRAVRDKLVEEATALPLEQKQLKTAIIYGPRTESLLRRMKEETSDLLVVGSHNGTEEKHGMLGSTAGSLARTASFPLLVVPHPSKAVKKECA